MVKSGWLSWAEASAVGAREQGWWPNARARGAHLSRIYAVANAEWTTETR